MKQISKGNNSPNINGDKNKVNVSNGVNSWFKGIAIGLIVGIIILLIKHYFFTD